MFLADLSTGDFVLADFFTGDFLLVELSTGRLVSTRSLYRVICFKLISLQGDLKCTLSLYKAIIVSIAVFSKG